MYDMEKYDCYSWIVGYKTYSYSNGHLRLAPKDFSINSNAKILRTALKKKKKVFPLEIVSLFTATVQML